MGLFSSKRKIRVYSQVLNMAGEKINYLGTVIGTSVIGSQQYSIAEQIQKSLLNGPGMNMRKFGRWCTQYNYRGKMGLATPRLMLGDSIDVDVLTTQLPAPPAGSRIVVSKAYLGVPDYAAWVDNWFIKNHPDQINDDYSMDLDEETGTIVTIVFADGRPGYTFQIEGFNPEATYLYCTYMIVGQDTAGPVVEGDLIQVPSAADWPSIDGMDPAGSSTTPKTHVLKTTVTTTVSYSDGSPGSTDTTVTNRNQDYVETDNLYDSVEFIGSNPAGDETNSLRRILLLRQSSVVTVATSTTTNTEYLPGGVVKTTTIVTERENASAGYLYRRDTQVITNRKWSNQEAFMYAYGSGNPTLDAMFNPSDTNDLFYPIIPFRDRNRFMIDPRKPAEQFPPGYPYVPWRGSPFTKDAAAALKKLTNQDFEKTVKSIYKSTGIGGGFDVPATSGFYMVPSMPLNTKSMEGKKYLFFFFETLAQYSSGSPGQYSQWRVDWAAADESMKQWVKWRDAQAVPTDPLYGTPEPVRKPYPAAPGFAIGDSGWNFNYDVTLSWSAVSVTEGTGKGWSTAKKGQVNLIMGYSEEYNELVTSGGVTQAIPGYREMFTITRQVTDDTWKTLTVYDLVHTNVVYKGRAVVTRASQAFAQSEPSPLLIPLQERIFNTMSLKDATQMCLDNYYLLINSYTDVQVSSGFLVKLIMVVIVVVISVITMGSGTAPSVGLLGTAAAVGGTLGFTGYVAILVGTIANAVAAMLLTKLITMGAQAILGDQIGAVVGMIASIAAVNYGTSYVNGTSVDVSAILSSPETLMKLSVAAGKGYAEAIAKDTKDLLAESAKFASEYSGQLAEIQDKWMELLGNGRAMLDPLAVLDISQADQFMAENSTSFLSRTLLTGADIANMTNDIITNFAEVMTSTQLPT